MAALSLRSPPCLSSSSSSVQHNNNNATSGLRLTLRTPCLNLRSTRPHRSPSIKALSSPTPSLTQDDLKKLAADKAVEYVRSGMVLGLGTGSTAAFVVAKLGELLKSGQLKDIVGVPTSKRTQEQAASLGIPLSVLDDHPKLDLAIDGADEVDPNLDLVKGRGGALLREKMVEAASDKFVVVVDDSKMVTGLGGSGLAMPVEVVQFCWKYNLVRLQELFDAEGCEAKLRLDGGKPYVTDNMNYIVDLYFKTPIKDSEAAGREISALEGVVEHGLPSDVFHLMDLFSMGSSLVQSAPSSDSGAERGFRDSNNQSWLKILFSSYGIVKDSFIPVKRSKRGSRFGFVQFNCSVSAGIAISKANGLEVEGYFLFVKKAGFDLKNKRKTSGAMDSSKPREVNRHNNMGFRMENEKSYAQALKGRGNHDQKFDGVKRGRFDLEASNDVVDAFSGMVWPGLALDQNHPIPDCQSKDCGVCYRPIEEGDDEVINCSETSSPVVPETQDSSGEKVLNEENALEIGNSLEDLDHNRYVINDDGPFTDPLVDNCNPNQADDWDLVSNKPLIKFVSTREIGIEEYPRKDSLA
ncbi:hypothetical protein Vadar_009378 [Vaccinium darrowii]|uniref:Uncharacterized protein n=1 Tax=Vaccinium darrowii TaxID=229202 RepID=A0ACB7ZI03_9ERIC|nr:hypothetical protein Vadar_009378 [Vaccinium darrowii]